MTTHDPLLPAVVLQRKAVVYVRQSTPQQVQLNLESQRRQYELVEVARRRGFTNIEVIDDDLGRTLGGRSRVHGISERQEGWGHEVWTRRARSVGRSHLLCAPRSSAQRSLHRSLSGRSTGANSRTCS